MNCSEYIDKMYGLLMKNDVCIFGSGLRGQECQQYLRNIGIEPFMFMDNSEDKNGIMVRETKVAFPHYRENAIIIITVLHHYEEIRKQLVEIGYSKNDIYTYEDIMVLYYEKNIEAEHEKQKKIFEYPTTIQLPITHLCNFDCVMCGMKKQIKEKDFSPEELRTILCDKLFSRVKNVGVNGGEPFMRKDFLQCMDVLLETLPLLENINIISNGYFTSKIIENLEIVKEKCGKKGIRVNLAISVDGVGRVQDFHRGKEGAFKNADRTCRSIMSHKEQIVDRLEIICTLTKYNIKRINEVVVWAEDVGVDVSYNIATENVRITNHEKVEDFSVFSDPQAKMLTMEFFYNEYKKTKNEKYYALFLYLRDGKRYADCPCMHNDWITLMPDSEIGFCATRSKKLGSGLKTSPYELVQSNLTYLEELKNEFCEKCSHYMYRLNAGGLKELLKEELRNRDMEW